MGMEEMEMGIMMGTNLLVDGLDDCGSCILHSLIRTRYEHMDDISRHAWIRSFHIHILIQVATKALTAGILNGFGDILAQVSFSENGQAFDWKRLGIFTFLVRKLLCNTPYIFCLPDIIVQLCTGHGFHWPCTPCLVWSPCTSFCKSWNLECRGQASNGSVIFCPNFHWKHHFFDNDDGGSRRTSPIQDKE